VCSIIYADASKAKFPEHDFHQNFFFGPSSSPSLRFHTQLFCQLCRFQHRYRIWSSIVVLNQHWLLHTRGFRSNSSTPLVFSTCEFITLFNCVFWANRKLLGVVIQQIGRVALLVPFHLLSLHQCHVSSSKLLSSIYPFHHPSRCWLQWDGDNSANRSDFVSSGSR
jgi:hypothetical protein